MLAKLDHAKVVASRDPFIAPSIEQGHEVHAVGGRLGIRRRVRQRHLDSSRRLALHEHIVQHALGIDAFRVKHRIAAAERAESARVELPELRLF